MQEKKAPTDDPVNGSSYLPADYDEWDFEVFSCPPHHSSLCLRAFCFSTSVWVCERSVSQRLCGCVRTRDIGAYATNAPSLDN